MAEGWPRRWAGALLLGALAGSAVAEEGRRNAVFVIGEDRNPDNAFLAAGTRYYQQRMQGEDLLVTQAESWSDVREWLARSRARGDRPWGEVVIMAHGSQWTGASVPVFPDQDVLRGSELDRLIDSESFPSLDRAVVDEQTMLRVESCGVGRRADLLQRYVRLLSGSPQGMRVSASEQLVEFGADDRHPSRSWRRERPYRVSVHPGASAPDDDLRRLAAAGGKAIPAEMVLALPSPQCATPVRRLVGLAAVQTTLSDFGLRAGDLSWTIRTGSGSGCVLSGRAQVLSSVPQQIRSIGS